NRASTGALMDGLLRGNGRFGQVSGAEQQLQARHESIQRSEAGELAADEDCASLAGFIGFAWQGALARFKVGAGLAPLNAFMSRLELLLRA
ncbi:hypothetical protein ACV33E_30710, partial [Pseudomonas aeruginosa]